MKRALTILLVIAGVLVALVLLLAMSPVGWRIATGLLEGAVAGRSGLDLTIGSLRGNLLSDVSITDASLSVPGGPTILEIASIEASYDLPALVRGRVVVPELRASDAAILFEVGPNGELTGWSSFVAPSADTMATTKSWPIDVNLALTDWAIVLRDSAAGYEARLDGFDVEAAGGPGDFRATLGGSLSASAAGLSRPVLGSLSAEIVESEREVRIERLDVPTGLGTLNVTGRVSLEKPTPAVDLTVRSSVDLAAASSIARRGPEEPAPDVRGEIELVAAVQGPVDAIRYQANLVGMGLGVGRVGSRRVDVDLSGDLGRLKVDRFSLDLFGGRATGTATVGLAGLHDDPPRVPYEVSLNLTRLDLARLEPLLPEGSVGLGGLLSGRARLRAASSDPGDLDGSFDVTVEAFAVGDTLLGELAVEGTIANGSLEAAGRCCASVITVEAPIEDRGVRAVTFTANVSDLSVPAGVFGVPELAGSAAVEGSIDFGRDGFSLSATASLPQLTYNDLEVGPAHIEATGRDTVYALRFRAFGEVVQGEGSFDTAGRYRVSARVDSFDLATLMDETLRRRIDFEGAVTAAVSVRGSRNRRPAVEGTVLDLVASARGERAYLTTPFQFEAAPDTVHISWAAIGGTFGSISVTGGMSVRQSGEILARLDGIDLQAIANVVPDGLPAPLRGTVDGDVRLFGRRDRPSFVAEITAVDFAYGGLGLRTAALEAMNDSTDVLFDLRAESAVAGSVMAYGSIPIVPDSLRVMRPDRTREFGASILLTDFTLDAGPSLLPGIRGTKRFGADGAVLLAGRADSLGSIYGRGSFGSVFARFDLIEFDLADTLAFEIGGGDIELARTTINVTPRRTLRKEAGGAVVLGGVVRSDGGMDLSVSTEGLDVGQLVRAFGPEPRTSVTGRLDFSADVGGTFGDPTADFAWRLRRPAFSDYGFDEFSGRGGLAGGAVSIEEGVLSSGGRTVTVTGVIPVAASEETGEAPAPAREMDVRVSAGDFRLSGLSKLPPGIDGLDGRLYCDLALRGPLTAPVLSGSAILRGGSLRGFDLKEPVRDIGFELHAGDGAVLFTNAHARLGGGSVEASGAAELRPGEAATFRLKVDLRSPEVAVEDAFDARVRGRLVWAGSAAASALSGEVTVEKLDVTYDVGLVDLLTRRPSAIVIRRANEPASRIALDAAVDIEDQVDVKNSLVRLALKGGLEVRGTALEPRVTGRLDAAEGGTFKYRENVFSIESLEVAFMDPSRRDPYVHLVGTATVTDRSEDEYLVTIVFDGFARETLPQLSSEPPLTQGDIISLLTFGDTFGGLAAGPQEAGSSADRFSQLARGAFVSSLFGVAESTLERILRLDTVSVDEDAVAANGLVGADVTIGKVFGDRLRVNYTTAVGEFADQEVEVAFRLSKQISIETRADPEGNHGIGLRLRIPFK